MSNTQNTRKQCQSTICSPEPLKPMKTYTHVCSGICEILRPLLYQCPEHKYSTEVSAATHQMTVLSLILVPMVIEPSLSRVQQYPTI